MGVTVLAAGTSIPDALGSISAAQAGMGDIGPFSQLAFCKASDFVQLPFCVSFLQPVFGARFDGRVQRNRIKCVRHFPVSRNPLLDLLKSVLPLKISASLVLALYKLSDFFNLHSANFRKIFSMILCTCRITIAWIQQELSLICIDDFFRRPLGIPLPMPPLPEARISSAFFLGTPESHYTWGCFTRVRAEIAIL